MSYVNKTFSEQDMMSVLGELLAEGEGIETAVYCIFKPTGFFSGYRNIIMGYAGITDRDRFIICKYGLIGTEQAAYPMESIVNINITNFLLGQKTITLTFDSGKKNIVKIQAAPKVTGNGLPGQQQNLEKMVKILEDRKKRRCE